MNERMNRLLSIAISEGLAQIPNPRWGTVNVLSPDINPCTERLAAACELKLRRNGKHWELWAITPHDLFGYACGIISTLR